MNRAAAPRAVMIRIPPARGSPIPGPEFILSERKDMKTKQIKTRIKLAGLVIALTSFAGCASVPRETQAQHDDRIVRGMIDSLASPGNSHPSNRPR
jgi:hypothetical protein